jgi:hypothetical protein
MRVMSYRHRKPGYTKHLERGDDQLLRIRFTVTMIKAMDHSHRPGFLEEELIMPINMTRNLNYSLYSSSPVWICIDER